MKSLYYLVSTILFCVACNQQPQGSRREAIEEDVRKMLDQYYADIKAEGLTSELKYLDHSPDFYWVPPGFIRPLSYDTVAAILTRNAPRFKSVVNTFDTLRIVPLSESLASYTAILHSEMTEQSGEVMHTSMIESGLVIKRADGWKLLNGQTGIIGH